MKKLFTLIIMASLALTIQAQDITNTLGTDGNLIIKEGSNTLLDFTQDNIDGPKLFIGGAQGAAGFPTVDRNLNLLVDGYGAGLTINSYGTQGAFINKGVIDFYSNRGTVGTMLTAEDGDNIGELSFFGTNSSTNFQLAGAKIIVNVDGVPITQYAPMSFEFQTGNAAGTVATRLKISSEGTVNIANNLEVDGSMSLSINSGTTNYVLTETDYTYITNNSAVNSANVILPTATGIQGRVYIVKNTGSANQLLWAQSGEFIDGAVNVNLVQWQFVKVQSDGSNWIVIGESN